MFSRGRNCPYSAQQSVAVEFAFIIVNPFWARNHLLFLKEPLLLKSIVSIIHNMIIQYTGHSAIASMITSLSQKSRWEKTTELKSQAKTVMRHISGVSMYCIGKNRKLHCPPWASQSGKKQHKELKTTEIAHTKPLSQNVRYVIKESEVNPTWSSLKGIASDLETLILD